MQTIEGQCCGRCVKTKCKFNGAMYAVGDTWKSPDDCVMFECVKEVRICLPTELEEHISYLNTTKLLMIIKQCLLSLYLVSDIAPLNYSKQHHYVDGYARVPYLGMVSLANFDVI